MVIGRAKTYYQKWAFRVDVEGFSAETGFSKAGPLDLEVNTAEYREGGAIIPYRDPATGSFPPITLEKGSTDEVEVYNWMKDVLDAASNSGQDYSTFKRTVTIEQLDRTQTVKKRWTLTNAWPSKFNSADFDGSADEINIESVELTYDYFELEIVG